MLAQPQTFPCPNCNEVINDTMERCRYCSAPIDRQAAAAAAEVQGRVNQACSDASYLKTAALVMWAFQLLSLIPFVPLVEWGFLITFFVVLFLLIRWHIKFSGIQTNDSDYRQARRSKNVALLLWVAAIPLGFLLRLLAATLIVSLTSS